MFNRSAFNRAALNSTAAVALALSAAAWSAEATVTSAATLNHALRANIDCGAQAVFGGIREQFGFWKPTAGVTPVFESNTIYAGNGRWESTGSLYMYVLSVVFAEAGFDTTSVFTALPNAKFSQLSWATNSSIDYLPTKAGDLRGSISAGGTFDADSVVYRMVEGNWSAGAKLWLEATQKSGNTTYHDGFSFWDGECEFYNVPYLTATFTNGTFQQAMAKWHLNATGTYAGKGKWDIDSQIQFSSVKTVFGSAALTATSSLKARQTHTTHGSALIAAKATLTIKGTTVKSTIAVMQGSVEFALDGWVNRYGTSEMAGHGEMAVVPLRYAMMEFDYSIIGDLQSTGQVTTYGELSWNGVASSLAGGAVLTTAPAPDERIIYVEGQDRTIKVPSDNRRLEAHT